MNDAQIIEIAALWMMSAAKILGPLLGVTLVVGVGVGIAQAVTQVQEFTLTFVPKLAAVGLVIVVGGRWMLAEFTSMFHEMLAKLPSLLGL